jgi:hypothetical protein
MNLDILRKLAKSTKYQNLLVASKEQYGIALFANYCDFSNIQEYFLGLLYQYNTINEDIVIHKISKAVLTKDIYTDSYLTWKREKGFDTSKKSSSATQLVATKVIKFPKKDK